MLTTNVNNYLLASTRIYYTFIIILAVGWLQGVNFSMKSSTRIIYDKWINTMATGKSKINIKIYESYYFQVGKTFGKIFTHNLKNSK